MNRKLVFQLSMFGLAMGILTVFLIPSKIEPICWLVIFFVCAVIIARKGVPRPFVHGLLTSILNSFWITGAHVLLYGAYSAHHAQEVAAMATSGVSPRTAMLAIGPIIGIGSGLVLGLFALIASKIIPPEKSAGQG
jgi:hypothetical protein